ncbi:MAG: histidinol-phosphatase HisJ family protein [Peptococcaceae bacterium]|nr:histidinol-phosphatase HisJ family protein [Peptococcaceae bacterium]
MIPVDYHLHTRLCGHATGEVEEYLAAAARLGLREVGFADHLPLYFLPPGQAIPGYAMAEEDLPLYVEMVKKGAERSPVTVRLAIEADYVPGHEEKLASLLSRHSFDYIVGSVHFMDGWGFDNPAEIEEYSRREIDRVYEHYFILVQQAALSGLFDVMAHPDLVKKFNFRPARDLRPLYEDTARAFKRAGVCVEVNTAGLRYPAGEIYPSLELLQFFFKYGLPVTAGSDAHRPDQVGAGLGEALRLIRSAGYREIALFGGRRRSFTRIC